MALPDETVQAWLRSAKGNAGARTIAAPRSARYQRQYMHRYLLPFVVLFATLARAENLAPEAAYSVGISGFVYHGQIIPGSNIPADKVGYMDAPPWRGPSRTLTDGRRDGEAVTSWYWTAMNKRITVTFDLRRPAQVVALRAFPRSGTFDSVTARLADTEGGLDAAQDLSLAAAEGGFVWRGGPLAARFVRIVCASGAGQMSLSEVEIEGTATGQVMPGAPPAGLIVPPARNLTALTTLPDRPASVANVAARAGTKVTVRSTHYDGKMGRMVDDTCARDSDQSGRALVDGSPATAVSSFRDWYAHKTVTVDIDLGQPFDLERVVVWSAGHTGAERSYMNAYQVWLQTVPGAPWTPLGETRNPVLPAERPASQYPIASAALGRPAQLVRLRLEGVAQSAEVMRAGEVEVWGKPLTGPVSARTWRVKSPVPQIEPVAVGKPDPSYDWILHERLRGFYGYAGQAGNLDLLSRARQVGFNCFIMHPSGRDKHSEEGWREVCATWAAVQKRTGLKVIVSWPFGADERYGNTQFGAYQPGGPTLWKRTPCPLSQEYWDRVIGDRAVVAAQAGLTGFVADMEMYAADSTSYRDPCVCDRCWGSFVRECLEGVEADEVALADRPAWLNANELAADYARRQELGVMAILRRIEERAHAVQPGFLLGNLLAIEPLPGMARGLGTPTHPALIFAEQEYGGNLSDLAARVERLKAHGYPALYLTGLAPTIVRADRMAGLIVEAALPGAGWWAWSSLAYLEGSPKGYAHHPDFTAEEYWEAARAGHERLGDALAN